MKQRLVFWLTLLLGVATIVIGALNTCRGLEGKDTFGLLRVIPLSALLVLLLTYQKLRRNQERRKPTIHDQRTE